MSLMEIAATSRPALELGSQPLGWFAALLSSLLLITTRGKRLLGALYRFALIPFRWCGEQADAAKEIKRLTQQMNRVVGELTPNGGGSMKDCIGRIERRCTTIEEGLILGGQRERALLTDVPDGAFELGAHGDLIWSNRTFCKWIGRQSEELLGRGWEQCVSPDERAAVIEEWDRSAKVGREMFIHAHFLRPDSSKVYLQIHSYPIRNGSGAAIGYIARCQMIQGEEGKAA